jgi:heptosyltransferase-1
MRLALVRLSALGDIIHTWPLALALRKLPEPAEITWIVERPLACLVKGHPAVDRVLTVDTRAWRRRPLAAETRAAVKALRSELRALEADVCLDPQGVAKSAFVTHLSQAPRRIGFDRRWRRELAAGFAYTQTVALGARPGHATFRFRRLAEAIGAPPGTPWTPDGRWLLAGRSAPSTSDRAVLLPGAGRPGKILSVNVLAAVATALGDHGLSSILAWGPGERERAEAIADASGGAAQLAPPTSILELADLLAGSRVVIGADTGPIHLAASLGVRTLAVHLATDPERNGPLGPRSAAVSAVAPQRGRGRSSAARRVREVGTDEIVTRALELLTTPPHAR